MGEGIKFTYVKILFTAVFLYFKCISGFMEPKLFPEKGNVWEYLAKEVLNTTDFCLAGGRSVKDILTTCLMGVAVAPKTITNNTRFREHPLTASYYNIFRWGASTYIKDNSMYTLQVAAVTQAATCFTLIGCHTPRISSCYNLTNTELACNSTIAITFSYGYIKLPTGWFLLCGLKAYSYLPANSTGGPCTLGRLTMLMPSLQRRQRRSFQTLPPDCDSKTSLLTKAEYIALAVSLVGVPGLAARNSRSINSLACTLAKSLNTTSHALDALNKELRQVREATLENRAAIDYLLLRHNHGCEEFRGLCCFNLSDQSGLIERDIKNLKELAQNIGHNQSPWDLSWLFSWLPDFHWLKILIAGVITVIVGGALLCCLCQIAPLGLKCLKVCTTPIKGEELTKKTSLMMSQIDHHYRIYEPVGLITSTPVIAQNGGIDKSWTPPPHPSEEIIRQTHLTQQLPQARWQTLNTH